MSKVEDIPKPVIVSAVRTAVATSFKGSLVNTPAEVLATTVLQETIRRSGVEPSDIDDVIFAESHYGGGQGGAVVVEV
jgi:acetyl-CoA acetyltransferase